MKADNASTQEGRGFAMLLLSVLYLTRRATIEVASKANLFITILCFPFVGSNIGKVLGGNNVANSNRGICISLIPRAIAAQLLRKKKKPTCD